MSATLVSVFYWMVSGWIVLDGLFAARVISVARETAVPWRKWVVVRELDSWIPILPHARGHGKEPSFRDAGNSFRGAANNRAKQQWSTGNRA
ncbi:MAG: hypothetical protein N2C14_20765 [Planctomycetales bacterium]